ncbi:Vomp family autotransporter [Bartonella doshiae]|uniref:Vomp family autotransporter n=1 Tax=Bartonella doshiae TaxID=33044 RepID=UPI000943DB14|nr:Vomp family autotransporter [Bartonella doshiae]
MRKLYSTTNLARAISLGAAVATLLSSVSPVFAANLAITGQSVKSTDGPEVAYKYGSHGSVVLAGDNDFCGADNVVGRGGKQQQNLTNKITAEEQYSRFINDQEFWSRNPYGTTTESVTWAGDGATTPKGGYMGAITGGYVDAMPEAYGVYSFATGCGSAATGNYSTVFGAGATAKAGGAQAFGVSALASGKVSVAMGVGTEASGDSTVAIGGLSTALGQNSIALGTRARAEKNFAIALGTDAEAKGSGSIAIGGRRSDRTEQVDPNRKVRAEGENAIAIGSHTYAKTEDSVAIGANAQVLVNDGVAVGGGSVSDRDKGVVGYDPYIDGNSTEKNMVWKSTTGAFSVGEVGGQGQGTLTRQITGVAAGSQDTDAVNVAQLKAMKGLITEAGGGWKISVNDTDSTDVTPGSTVDFSVKNDNLKIEKASEDNKQKVKFALSDNLKLTGVTTGNASMSDDGFMFSGGASITVDGIHAGNKKIAGVEAGEDDTDAVNMAQLRAVQEAGKKVWQLSVNKGNATAVKSNDTVNFQAVGDEGKQNIKIGKNEDHDVTFALADNITVKSVTAGNASMSDDGFMFTDGGPSITVNGIDAGNKKITGVMAGTANTDAVNKAQLDNAVTDINNNINNSVINQMDKFAVLYDKNGDDSVNYNSVTLGGGKTNGQVILRNVKDGDISEESHDAVNGSQLYTMSNVFASYFGGGAGFNEKGEWNGPTFHVYKINNDGTLTKNPYGNVADAFEGVNDTFDIISNRITNIAENSLVKQDGGVNSPITVGKETGGTKIDITGSDGVRTIAGVKAAVNDDEAVNKKQLNDAVENINNVINKTSDFAVLYDKKNDGTVNYNSVTLGGGKTNGQVALRNVKDGDISAESTDAINGRQLFDYADTVSQYFGGETDVIDGIKPNFIVQDTTYNNVTEAFAGVDNSITDIYSKITNIAENSLVKQDGGVNSPITVGKETGGTKIDITGSDGVRTIAGVKAAVNDDEAVNKKQLNDAVADINNNVINQMDKFAVLYDKNSDDSVNYNSVTLGGGKTNGQVILRNVKDGDISEESHDAINGSQINTISQKVAEFFGGGTKFENGVFRKPRYQITTIDENSQEIEHQEYNDVGSALSGLDMNIRHVNNHLIHAINDVADYFGGGAGYDEEGEWHAPIFKVIQFNANGAIKNSYDNVADAFEGVNDTFSAIHNQITNITENSLVKQDGEEGLITVGKATGGTKISIANKNGDARTISDVKDGTLSKASTEAVNGSQLFTINQNITNELTTIAQNTSEYFGGSTDVLEGIEPTFVINNEVYRNVTDAFTGVNTSIKNIDDKIIEMKENNLVQQDGVSNIITIGAKTAGTEINIAGYAKVARSISGVKAAEKGDEAVNKDQLDKNIEKISKDIEIASAAAVLYDKDANGGINYGSVTLGGDKGKGPVSLLNVKDGRITEGSTDAITGNQLYLMSNQLANYFGGGAKYENGQWTAPNFKISQVNADGTSVEKNYTTVAEAFDGINNGMSNINNRIDDVINKVDSDALKWNEKEGAYDANHGGRPSKITNVANGIIAENSKDAVNGGQLWETNERITDVENHVEILDKRVDNISNTIGDIGDTVINIENKVNDIAEDAVRYDRDENGKKTNKITLVGGDASEPVMIDNVADGNIETGSKEAVNGGQLHDYTQEQMKIILDKSKHYTDQRVNNIVIDAIDDAVERANNYTDMKFEALSYDINSVRQEARQAAAIGLAVSNLRYNDTPGKLSVAFGGGLWRNQSAIAFGAGYTSEKGDIRSNLSVTSSGGHWGIGAGLSLTLN